MSELFFVRIRGTQRGPFPISKLQELVKTGQMSRMNEVSTDGTGWRPAAEFPEIFSPIQQPQVVSQPAQIATQVSQDESVGWYVTIGGHQNGPYPLSQIQAMIQAGQIIESDFVWHDQMHDWQPAGSVPEVASCFGTPVASAVAVNQQVPVADNSVQVGGAGPSYSRPASVTRRVKPRSNQGVNLIFASISSGMIVIASIMVFLPWSSTDIVTISLTQSGFQMVTGDFSSPAQELIERAGGPDIEEAREQFREEVDRAFLILGVIVCLLAALALAYIHLLASAIASIVGLLLSLVQLGIGFPMAADENANPFHSIAYGFWIFMVASIIAVALAMIGHFMGPKAENESAESLTEY
jgi:multisubunit Na+/H+ antiporter MnhG subunit